MKTTLSLIFALTASALASILPYPPPGDLAGIAHLGKSSDYTVTLSGSHGPEIPVFVYATSNYWENPARRKEDAVSFTSFAFTNEPVTVTVTCAISVDNAVLRPKSSGVDFTRNGKVIRFTLYKPQQLALDIPGSKNPLLIFAEAPETIDAKATHYYAPGTVTKIGDHFKVGEGESVYVAGGAVIEGTFLCTGNHNSFRGRGIVSSGHIPWQRWVNDHSLCQIGAAKWKNFHGYAFDDLILLNSPGWWCMGQVTASTVRNVKFIAWNGNSDGIHLGGDSLMEGCFFFVNDDCLIANDGNNNTWRKCIVWRSPWGAPIVSLLSRRQSKDFLWEDIDVISTEGKKPLISLIHYAAKKNVEGARFENYTIRDLHIEGPRPGILIKIDGENCLVKNYRVENVIAETQREQEGQLIFPNENNGSTVLFRNVVLGGKTVLSSKEAHIETKGDQSGLSFSK